MKKTVLFIICAMIPGWLSAQTGPVIRKGEHFFYASLECQGSYAQLGEKLGFLMEELARQDADMAGEPMGIFHNAPGQVKEEDLLWEIAAPVADETAVQPPLIKKEFACAEQAEISVKGPYGDAGSSIGTLMGFVFENGYKPCGPVFETWMDDPSHTNPEDCRTLIVIPVEKKAP